MLDKVFCGDFSWLQQRLPLAVLKRSNANGWANMKSAVATALTACGIETITPTLRDSQETLIVATALTACGIETLPD